ncbi:MAG TPA: hypothetical protein VIJ47_11085 [Acidimicrobiales bacterium]
MPAPRPHRLGSTRQRRRARVIAAGSLLAVALATVAVAVGRLAPAADARVTPRVGFHATVSGWTSWYGSYDLGALGPAWCIDHGLSAPDPAFVYLPTALPDVDPSTGAALSWAVSAHGFGNDPVEAAAVMLALHDLRHAAYPGGPLDVDGLTVARLAGFGGHEGAVLERARAIKAEARAHAHLRAPFHLAAVIDGAATGQPILVATLTDANGAAVAGAGVHVDAQGADVDQPPPPGTGPAGTVRVQFRPRELPAGASFTVHAIVPDPTPAAFAASTVRAQRVVRSSWIGLDTTVAWTPPAPPPVTAPPTTATTRPPTTTTTRPTTTTTSLPPTTTRSLPTTGPSLPPTPTSLPATTTTSLPTTGPMLPRTGASEGGLVALGLGLVAGGTGLVGLSRRPWSDASRSRQ